MPARGSSQHRARSRKAATAECAGEPEAVFNLEVQFAHVYHVTAAGVLVHNARNNCAKLAEGQFRDVQGRLRDGNGRYAFDGGSSRASSGSGHGNSHATTKPAQGYTLRDKDNDEIVKYGETTMGRARYTQSELDQMNAYMQFEAAGTKKAMHQWQHERILDYKATHGGMRPKYNFNDY